MNQPELAFRSTGGGMTQNEKLRRIFKAQPGVWHSMTRLGELIRAWAVHSRVADLRKLGMRIESRSVRDTITGQRHSYYRYTP